MKGKEGRNPGQEAIKRKTEDGFRIKEDLSNGSLLDLDRMGFARARLDRLYGSIASNQPDERILDAMNKAYAAIKELSSYE